MGKSLTRFAKDRCRALTGLVLALLYLFPVLFLPAAHLAGEALEQRGCEACSSAVVEVALPGLEAACSPLAPCRDSGHRHHNHAPHDPAHCTVCTSLGGALVEAPRAAPALLAPLDAALASSIVSLRAPGNGALRIELARAPPARSLFVQS